MERREDETVGAEGGWEAFFFVGWRLIWLSHILTLWLLAELNYILVGDDDACFRKNSVIRLGGPLPIITFLLSLCHSVFQFPPP